MLSRSNTLAQQVVARRAPQTQPLVRDALLVVCGTILMALCAQISVYLPWNPIVPITMQTFGVLLIGALYGPRLGAAALAVYLLQGMAGLPVFAGGRSAWSASSVPGLPVMFGPTAGYLFSYPFAAAVVGVLAARGWDRSVRTAIPAMLLGNVVILAAGFCWLFVATMLLRGSADAGALFNLAVVPFLSGDALKIIIAALALPGGWALLKR